MHDAISGFMQKNKCKFHTNVVVMHFFIQNDAIQDTCKEVIQNAHKDAISSHKMI